MTGKGLWLVICYFSQLCQTLGNARNLTCLTTDVRDLTCEIWRARLQRGFNHSPQSKSMTNVGYLICADPKCRKCRCACNYSSEQPGENGLNMAEARNDMCGRDLGLMKSQQKQIWGNLDKMSMAFVFRCVYARAVNVCMKTRTQGLVLGLEQEERDQLDSLGDAEAAFGSCFSTCRCEGNKSTLTRHSTRDV